MKLKTHTYRRAPVWAALLGAVFAMLLTFAPALTGPASAQTEAPSDTAQQQTEQAEENPNKVGFEAGDEVPKENLPGWPFLYAAYGVIWLLLMGYLVYLWRSQKSLDAEIARLDERLDEIDRELEKRETS